MKTYILFCVQILFVFSTIYSQNIWERTNGLDTVEISSLAVVSNGDIIAGSDTNYIYRSSDDGTSWTNLGMKQLKTTGIAIKPNGDIVISSLDHHLGGGVFVSSDNGNNWSNLNFTSASTAIAINQSGHLFVGRLTEGIVRSTDNGTSWVAINQGLSDTHPLSIIVNPSGHIFVATEFGGVFRSTNNGDNWFAINQGLTFSDIHSLAINSNGHIFAGSYGAGVFRSTDNGGNWLQINQGITPGQGYYVYSFVINSSGEIFIGTSDGVFRSSNNGDNWVRISQGLTNLAVWSLTIDTNEYVYAGTQNGIFRSINPLPVELSSFTIQQMTDKIQLKWITKTEVNNYGFNVERKINKDGEWNSIAFVEGHGNSNSPKMYSYIDKDLFAGGSKFQYRLKQVDTDGSFEYSDVVEVEVVPNQFELSQNYPNPFNPSTTIQFSLPKQTQLKLTLYNILGEQVATIAEGMYESGYHKIEFNAESLPSGTYIYRFMSDSFVQTKKMMILR